MASILGLRWKGNRLVISVGKLQLPDHSGICEREPRHSHQPLRSSFRASSSPLCISFRLSVTFTLSQRGPNHTASCSSAGRAPIRMPCAHKTRRKWSAAFHAYSTSNEIKSAVMLLVAPGSTRIMPSCTRSRPVRQRRVYPRLFDTKTVKCNDTAHLQADATYCAVRSYSHMLVLGRRIYPGVPPILIFQKPTASARPASHDLQTSIASR